MFKMFKRSHFLSFLLMALYIGSVPLCVVASPFDSAKSFGVAWQKFVTGKSLDDSQAWMIKGSLGIAGITTCVGIMTSTLWAIVKIERDLKRGIREQDNELVRRNVPRIFKVSRGIFIWFALYNNNHEALKILLDHGADPNNRFFIRTPLCIAFARDDFESAHILLDYGANPLLPKFGVRPLDYSYKDEALAKKMREKMEEAELKYAAKLERKFCKPPVKNTGGPSFFARAKRKVFSPFVSKQESEV